MINPLETNIPQADDNECNVIIESFLKKHSENRLHATGVFITFFETAELPKTLRLDCASTPHEIKDVV
jgi:hypothetical protein